VHCKKQRTFLVQFGGTFLQRQTSLLALGSRQNYQTCIVVDCGTVRALHATTDTPPHIES